MTTKNFDVRNEALSGKKLIEASAGTGKTFSIAILALRLILEAGTPLEKILMVTFTKAAVAELETRIRLFIRTGLHYLEGTRELNATDKIREVIENCSKDSGEKKKLLKAAVQSLNELSVMTIHSFCQSAIDEFTFETGQSFNYEIVRSDNHLLENEARKYFREVINTVNFETFREFIEDWPDMENLAIMLRKHLRGMKFIDYKANENADPDELKKAIGLRMEEFDAFIEEKRETIVSTPMRANNLKSAVEEGNFESFRQIFRDQLSKSIPAGYFEHFRFMEEEFRNHDSELIEAEKQYALYFYHDFFSSTGKLIQERKQSRGIIAFDDQIRTISEAMGNNDLKSNLRKKYDAVFIDEFQDTDEMQYKIFDSLFGKGCGEECKDLPVFYIGDPKQSIYGWRGADLDTYKAARDEVDEPLLTMNQNFRSTPKMVTALNDLLDHGEDFNLFEDDKIRYRSVEAGASNPGIMMDNGEGVSPITIWQFEEVNAGIRNYRKVAMEIHRLLSEDVKIGKRRLRPGDIGVLVRANYEGETIKNLLAEFQIPAVRRDDAKVLKSSEAMLVKYLLKAVLTPRLGTINRTLLSPWLGFKLETIRKIDDGKHLDLFRKLNTTLLHEGVYNMISEFMNLYDVRQLCMESVLGLRALTNINHLAEILHKIEKQYRYSPEELLTWLDRNREEGNEEYEQRIESDDDAVQISTIHKAKGLEYPVVFAPCLSMIPGVIKLRRKNVNDFKDEERKYCFTFDYPGLSEEHRKLHDDQKEQENRRIIYVALTRAVHKSYISHIPRKSNKNEVRSSLDPLMEQYRSKPSAQIEQEPVTTSDFVYEVGEYNPPEGQDKAFSSRAVPKDLEIRKDFSVHSFSSLNTVPHSVQLESTGDCEEGSYDHFIFQDLARGAKAGTALHSIFEHLAFNKPDTWEQSLKNASGYYSDIIKEDHLEYLRQMVRNVLHAKISLDEEEVDLSLLLPGQMLQEMGFFFSVDRVSKTLMDRLLGEEAELRGKSDLQGLMTGFIDLIFEQNGKYYILDWKSNHLGNRVEAYGPGQLEGAMTGNNYTLQYLIYTVALKRWLETRIPDFDYDRHFGGVIYIFLRGARDGQESGIYTTKPDKKDIEELDKGFGTWHQFK